MTTDPRIAPLAAALPNALTYSDHHPYDLDPIESAAAILAALPGWMLVRSEAGTRLIRVGYDLEQFGARTADGRLQTAEWREPLDDGTYEPLFTATDDGMTLLTTAELARLRAIEEAARAVERVMRQYASLFGGGIGRDERTVLTALDALRAALGSER